MTIKSISFCLPLMLVWGALAAKAQSETFEYPPLRTTFTDASSHQKDSVSFALEAHYQKTQDTLGLIYTYGNRLFNFERNRKGLSDAVLFFLENEGVEKKLPLPEQYKVQMAIYTFYWGGSPKFTRKAITNIERIIVTASANNWDDIKISAFLLKHYLLEGKSNAYQFPDEIAEFYLQNPQYYTLKTVEGVRINVLAGRYYLFKEDFFKAEGCFQKSLDLSEKIDRKSIKLNSMLFLAKVQRLNGEYRKTIANCQKVLGVVNNHDDKESLDIARWANEELANTYAKLGNLKLANKNWQQYDAKIKAYHLEVSKTTGFENSFIEKLEESLALKTKQEELNRELLLRTAQRSQALRQLNLALIAIGLLISVTAYLWFGQRQKQSKKQNELLILAKQEEEREGISRELHDYVGNTLIAIKNALQTNTYEPNKLQKLLDEVYYFVRNASHQLNSSMVAEIGLIESCKEYINFIDTEKKIKSYFPASQVDVATNKGKAIFRIIQELVHNALQHSGAEEVRFALYMEENEIRIHIEDNGKGFDPANISNGNGIANIQHRAKLLDGNVEIDSSHGIGTSIWIRIPT